MKVEDLPRIRNGAMVPRDAVPTVTSARFRDLLSGALAEGHRVASLFGHASEWTPGQIEIFAVLAQDTEARLSLCAARLEGGYFRSLAASAPEVHLFEREIAEQFGVEPLGHPALNPVRFQEPLASKPGSYRFGRKASQTAEVGVAQRYRIEGEALHEVGLGPVWGGISEPVHLRLQCHGEEVLHLDVGLGYQHRGIERALVGGPDRRTRHLMETIAGDSSVGHATAYARIVEALRNARPPTRGMALRAIALELERVTNHAGDLAALAEALSYSPAASHCGRIRDDLLEVTALICGDRLGRGMVRPGGVHQDLDEDRIAELQRRLAGARADLESAVRLMWDTPSVGARLKGIGELTREQCTSLGMVGPAARASGCERDVRRDFPHGFYRFVHAPSAVWHSGDVFARAWVRWLEIDHSFTFIGDVLGQLPESPHRVSAPVEVTAREAIAVSLVEGWRGEICHVALTDAKGRFARYKVVDPSFHNWIGLALALRDQPVSDFSLCERSFGLSVAGHDL